jgi:YVTN family beta-propeller protein
VNTVNGRTAAHDDRGGRSFDVNIFNDDDIFNHDGAPAARIAVGHGPISDLAASADGDRLVVTNYGCGSVSVIDTRTRRVTETLPGLDEPFTVALGARDAGRAYVSTVSSAYDAIAVVDLAANTVIARHPLALSATDLAVSPDGSRVYVSRNGDRGADLAVLDTATGRTEAVDLAAEPGTTTECVRVAADGARVYVAVNGPDGGRLVTLRGDGAPRVVDSVGIGLAVRDVALSPDGDTAYVASCTPVLGAVIDVVDTRTHKITATRKIDAITGLLTRMSLSADGRRAYLVSDDGVATLSTDTFDVLGAVEVADQASCVVESPDAKCLYIADYAGGVNVAPTVSAVAPILEVGGRHEKRALEPALA